MPARKGPQIDGDELLHRIKDLMMENPTVKNLVSTQPLTFTRQITTALVQRDSTICHQGFIDRCRRKFQRIWNQENLQEKLLESFSPEEVGNISSMIADVDDSTVFFEKHLASFVEDGGKVWEELGENLTEHANINIPSQNSHVLVKPVAALLKSDGDETKKEETQTRDKGDVSVVIIKTKDISFTEDDGRKLNDELMASYYKGNDLQHTDEGDKSVAVLKTKTYSFSEDDEEKLNDEIEAKKYEEEDYPQHTEEGYVPEALSKTKSICISGDDEEKPYDSLNKVDQFKKVVASKFMEKFDLNASNSNSIIFSGADFPLSYPFEKSFPSVWNETKYEKVKMTNDYSTLDLFAGGNDNYPGKFNLEPMLTKPFSQEEINSMSDEESKLIKPVILTKRLTINSDEEDSVFLKSEEKIMQIKKSCQTKTSVYYDPQESEQICFIRRNYRVKKEFHHIKTISTDFINLSQWSDSKSQEGKEKRDKFKRKLYGFTCRIGISCIIIWKWPYSYKEYLKLVGFCKSLENHNVKSIEEIKNEEQYNEKEIKMRKFVIVIPNGNNPSISVFSNIAHEISHVNPVTRQIRGIDRVKMKEVLDKTLPHSEMIRVGSKLDPIMRKKGNFDQPFGKKSLAHYDVYRKMRSEIDSDNRESICQFMDLIIKKEQQSLEPKTAYLRLVHQETEYIKPKMDKPTREIDVYIFDQEVVLILKKGGERVFVLYFDATGAMITDLKCFPNSCPVGYHNSSRILIYSGTIIPRIPEVSFNTLIPVGQRISSMHNTQRNQNYFDYLKNKILNIEKIKWPFKCIVLDWSFALINAANLSFNECTTVEYLNTLYQENDNDPMLQCDSFTYIVLCVSHYVKIICDCADREISRLPRDKDYNSAKMKNFMVEVFCLLMQATSRADLTLIIQLSLLITKSPFQTPRVTGWMNELTKQRNKLFTSDNIDDIVNEIIAQASEEKIFCLKPEDAEHEELDEDFDVQSLEDDKSRALRNQLTFYKDYLKMLKNVDKILKTDTWSELDVTLSNELFDDGEILPNMFQRYLPFIGLWALHFNGRLTGKNLSNAPVENLNRRMKESILKRPPVKIGKYLRKIMENFKNRYDSVKDENVFRAMYGRRRSSSNVISKKKKKPFSHKQLTTMKSKLKKVVSKGQKSTQCTKQKIADTLESPIRCTPLSKVSSLSKRTPNLSQKRSTSMKRKLLNSHQECNPFDSDPEESYNKVKKRVSPSTATPYKRSHMRLNLIETLGTEIEQIESKEAKIEPHDLSTILEISAQGSFELSASMAAIGLNSTIQPVENCIFSKSLKKLEHFDSGIIKDINKYYSKNSILALLKAKRSFGEEQSLELRDFETLKPNEWLSGSTVDFLISMVIEHSKNVQPGKDIWLLNTMKTDNILKVNGKAYYNGLDLADEDMLFISQDHGIVVMPILLVAENHFTLAVVDLDLHEFIYMDSMVKGAIGKAKSRRIENFMRSFINRRNEIRKELNLMNEKENISLWNLRFTKDHQLQKDVTSCGVCVIQNVIRLLKYWLTEEGTIDIAEIKKPQISKPQKHADQMRADMQKFILNESSKQDRICLTCRSSTSLHDQYTCYVCERAVHIQCFENNNKNIRIEDKYVCSACCTYLN